MRQHLWMAHSSEAWQMLQHLLLEASAAHTGGQGAVAFVY